MKKIKGTLLGFLTLIIITTVFSGFMDIATAELSCQNETVQITKEFEVESYSFGPDVKFSPLSSYNGSTYFIWCDGNYRPFLTKITGSTVVTSPLDPDPEYTALADGHNKFSLGIDKEGYIHVTGDMHNYPSTNPHYPPRYNGKKVMYWVSDQPESISGFTFRGADTATAIPGTGFSYYAFYTDRNGELYFMARGKVNAAGHHPGEHGVILSRYDTTTQTWIGLGGYAPNPKGATHKSVLWEDNGLYHAEDPARSWYQGFICSIVFDENNRLHFAASICNDNMQLSPTHVVYAYSDDGGETFNRADGTAIETLPMRAESGPSQADIVSSDENYGTTCYPLVDRNNNPAVCYRRVVNGIAQNAVIKYWEAPTQTWSDPIPVPGVSSEPSKNHVDPRGVSIFVGNNLYRANTITEEGYRLPVYNVSNIDERGLRDTGVIRALGVIDGKLCVIRIQVTPNSWSWSNITDFDGMSTYVDGGKDSGSGQDLTASFSMTADKLANMTLIDKEPSEGTKGWSIKLKSDGSMCFRIGSSASFRDVCLDSAYTQGIPVNITCTFGDGTARIYQNGALKTTVTGITQTVDESTVPLYLGMSSTLLGEEAYEGTLEYVKVYNRVLRNDEIFDFADGLIFINDNLISFNGVDDFVQGGTAHGSAPNLTVAFRMTADKMGNMIPIDKEPYTGTKGWTIKLRSDGALNFRVGSNASLRDVGLSNAYTVNTPVHIVCTFSEGTAKIYQNGDLKRTITGINQTVDESTMPLRLGISGAVSQGEKFAGTLDNVRIYNRALSDSEVLGLFNIASQDDNEDLIFGDMIFEKEQEDLSLMPISALSSGNIFASIDITKNNEDVTETPRLIVALFDKIDGGNKLVDVKMSPVLAFGDRATVTLRKDIDIPGLSTGDYELRVLVWDDILEMKPVMKKVVIDEEGQR